MTTPPDERVTDERLLALFAASEDQLTAVRAGIEGLTLERAALAKERVAVVQEAERLRKAVDKLAADLEAAVPKLFEFSLRGAAAGVKQVLTEATKISVQAAAAAAQPTIDAIQTSVSSATAMQLELKKAVREFRRTWTWFVALTMAAMILSAALVCFAVAWMQWHQLEQLSAQRDQLAAEVNELQRQRQAEQSRRGAVQRPAK